MADLQGTIRQFICDNFIVDGELADDESMLEKEIIDSTGILELVAFLEKQFEIRIADEEIVPDNLDSVNRICDFLSRKCPEKGLAAPRPAAR